MDPTYIKLRQLQLYDGYETVDISSKHLLVWRHALISYEIDCLYVFDLASGNLGWTLALEHDARVCKFSNEGNAIVIILPEHVRVYSAQTGRLGCLVIELAVASGMLPSLAEISPDGRRVAIASEDGNVISVYDMSGRPCWTVTLASHRHATICWCLIGLVVNDWTRTELYDIESGQRLRTLSIWSQSLRAVSRDGRRLLQYDANGSFSVVDVPTGRVIYWLHKVGRDHVRFLWHSGQSVVVLRDGRIAEIHDVDKPGTVWRQTLCGPAEASGARDILFDHMSAISCDGTVMMVAQSECPMIRVFDLSSRLKLAAVSDLIPSHVLFAIASL